MSRFLKAWPAAILLAAILLIVAQFALTYTYLHHERAINFWDYAMYANMATMAWSQQTLGQMWGVFTQSFAQNYNLFFAVPSFFSFSFFGPTRSVFILTNLLVYFTAFQAAAAWVLARCLSLKKGEAFLSALLLSCLVPFAWYPLLEGYPDHAAAACLAAGVAVALGFSRSWKKGVALGLFCGLAVVFRRHYAYAAAALFIVRGLFDLVFCIKERDPKSVWLTIRHSLVALFPFYVGLLIGFFAVLIGMEPTYFKEMLTTNYMELYKSYERPPSYFLLFALGRVGLGLAAAVCVGYVWAYRKHGPAVNKKTAAFVSVLTGLWVLLWSLGPAQAGEHYLIAVLPLFCLVGLALLFVQLWGSRWRQTLLPVVALGLVANASYALWLAPSFVLPSDAPRLSVFSTPRPPWVRSDYEELKRLALYLGQTTNDDDKIVIAGSSFIFNQDLVRALYTDVLKNIRPAFRFLPAPESDGQQQPPLTVYALANVYVVAVPTQYHLDPAGQKVVTGLASLFPPPASFSTPFAKDDTEFHLERGVTVQVWRRGPWVSADLHQGLLSIRALKASDRYWTPVKAGGFVDMAEENGQGATLLIRHPAGRRETTLFYDKPLTGDQTLLSFSAQNEGACSSLRWTVQIDHGNGAWSTERDVLFDPQTQQYALFLGPPRQDGFLTLKTKTESRGACAVVLRNLQISPTN